MAKALNLKSNRSPYLGQINAESSIYILLVLSACGLNPREARDLECFEWVNIFFIIQYYFNMQTLFLVIYSAASASEDFCLTGAI